MNQTEASHVDELAELEEVRRKENRVVQIRITNDGAQWTRAGGGWRKVTRQEARDEGNC